MSVVRMATCVVAFFLGVERAPGAGKCIVWDMGVEDSAPLSINKQITPSDDYLVIDLSGGTSASNYPISSLSEVPKGGWTHTYKTIKLLLRKIPAGTFMMGSPSNELGRYSDETQHVVKLTQAFYIGVFEVTQQQWELVMGNRPSYFNNEKYYQARPVEQVSYYDIRENPALSPNWTPSAQVYSNSFMGKLRAKTGLSTFDLPTEAQWEYACRAGTTTSLNGGKDLTNIHSDANMSELGRYRCNGGSDYDQSCVPSAGTASVGSYLPNAWGLYDMHGNVWEWCLDLYGPYPGPVNDPLGAEFGSYWVKRGGSWYNLAQFCRSAYRINYWPDFQNFIIGFRVAMTLP